MCCTFVIFEFHCCAAISTSCKRSQRQYYTQTGNLPMTTTGTVHSTTGNLPTKQRCDALQLPCDMMHLNSHCYRSHFWSFWFLVFPSRAVPYILLTHHGPFLMAHTCLAGREPVPSIDEPIQETPSGSCPRHHASKISPVNESRSLNPNSIKISDTCQGSVSDLLPAIPVRLLVWVTDRQLRMQLVSTGARVRSNTRRVLARRLNALFRWAPLGGYCRL